MATVAEPLQRRSSQRCRGRPKPNYLTLTIDERPLPVPSKKVAKKRAKLDLEMMQAVPASSSPTTVLRDSSASVDGGVVAGGGEVGKSMHARVKETLRAFNSHYLHFVQQEELRYKENESKIITAKKSSKRKQDDLQSKKNGTENNVLKALKKKDNDGDSELKRASKRPDLKAVSLMKNSGSYLYPKKTIGHLPGIDVGDQFFSRAEMVVLGLHHHWLSGIDYVGATESKSKNSKSNTDEFKDLPLPLATSVVLSGMYEDNNDNKEEIIYTGQGGHDLLGNKQQVSDQKLVRGNLALKNCCLSGSPVRVIRGHDLPSSYTGKVYTYDGLYKVIEFWAEKGHRGFTVYQFKLKRLEGQPALTTPEVIFTRSKGKQLISNLRGLVMSDISIGQELIPIPVTNVIDAELPPKDFVYQKSLQVPENLKAPEDAAGCHCNGDCTDPRKCDCAKLNGSDFPYVRRDGGRLIEAKSVVFECGANCSCNINCINRVSQQGIRYHLEVFRTPSKGWGVRSWDTIPSGAPICEYTGILTRAEDIKDNVDNDYIFEIDCLQTMKGLDGRDKRPGEDFSFVFNIDEKKSEVEYCIDAGTTGNVARFINHSCQPNLFVQCVLSSHRDIKRAKVMLFAADNILPLEELTYDYGYVYGSVTRADGTEVHRECHCGEVDCRKWLY